jgi:anaerobic magnesium-protoporphyrin IX monomethyl ester cyclase
MMKVVLINPAVDMKNANWFPIGLGYIASVLQQAGFEVELIDIPGEGLIREDFQAKLSKVEADAFGIGGLVTAFNNVVDAAAYIRSAHPGAFLFSGNTVAYSIPEILLKNSEVSAIVLGEGEITVVELMRAVKEGRDLSEIKGLVYKDVNGNLVKTGNREAIKDIDALPFPAWDLMPIGRYFQNTKYRYCVVSTVRGCPYNCVYCCKTFMGYQIRYRMPASIMDELLTFHKKYGMDVFYFFDDLSTVNKARMLEFCRLKMNSIIKDVRWTISARVNLVDEELIIALKQAGCSQIGFGFESMDQGMLDSINKKVTVAQNEQAAALCDKHDMNYGGTSFMVGYVNESEDEIRKTAAFCRQHDLRYEPHFMTPFPETELYRYAQNAGLIKDELAYVKRLALQGNTSHLLINLTKNLGDAELTALRDKYIFYTSPYRKKGKLSMRKVIARAGILLKLPPGLMLKNIWREMGNLVKSRYRDVVKEESRDSNIWE